ncbi:signal peptidase II [Oerskovia sp. KBS0722]|uniref:signal peptidase II n=1 Tax=Oerskovia sp. KBS0722 TaxID=1179673 RepID=UPI001FEE00F7|nr:signal peptidase II [Oerskovia sp. KBS0722]
MPSTPSPQQPVPADPSEGGTEAVSAAPTTDARPRTTVAPRRLVLWVVVLAALVILVDQVTKIWAVAELEGRETIELLGEWLHLTFIRNEGAALGIGSGYTWILTIVVTVVIVFILRSMRKIGSRGWAIALGLLLGGALGNLIDRIFREPGFAQGHVVDFIGYGDLFIGNVADIAVVAAAVMIAILSVQGIGIDGQRHVDQEQDQEPAKDDAGEGGSGAAERSTDVPEPGAPTTTSPSTGPQGTGAAGTATTSGPTAGTES